MDFKDQVKDTLKNLSQKTKELIEETKAQIKSGELKEKFKDFFKSAKDNVVDKIKKPKK